MITIFGSGGGQLPTLNTEPSSETSREGAVSPTLVVDEDSHDNNNRQAHCQQNSLPTHFPISKDIYEITYLQARVNSCNGEFTCYPNSTEKTIVGEDSMIPSSASPLRAALTAKATEGNFKIFVHDVITLN